MNAIKIQAHEYDLISRYIEETCGISLGPGKSYLVEGRLRPLLGEAGQNSFGDFYYRFAKTNDRRMRDRIVDAITTNETLWFRDAMPWQLLRDQVLPLIVGRGPPSRRIRIWSAACSAGQEPYSVAMVVDDFCHSQKGGSSSPEQFEILATDISPSALFVARAGRYDGPAMERGIQGEFGPFRDRYFQQDGRHWMVRPKLRARVRFASHNLGDPPYALGKFDLVFLRNVAIYFSSDFKKQLTERLASVLNARGLLCIGVTETLLDPGQRFARIPTMRGYHEFVR